MLENYIRNRLREKPILLMTHMVVGYPSLDSCYRLVETMVQNGADMIELQVPFSEPIADGPVIAAANQQALERGVRVEQCFELARALARDFAVPFLLMSYYNVPFRYGLLDFAGQMAACNLRGAIVPDLPLEEAGPWCAALQRHALAHVAILSPTTPPERMALIASRAQGFLYCVSRRGVTGRPTAFTQETADYLAGCRRASHLPLAVGFGLQKKTHLDFLKGRVEIAVVGSEVLRVMKRSGINAVGEYIAGLLS